MSAPRVAAAGLLLLLIATGAAASVAPAEVHLSAESMRHYAEGDLVDARGAVRLNQGGLTLLSDRLIFSGADNVAVAEGGVVIERPDATLLGDRAVLDVVSGQAQVSNLHLLVKKGNLHLLAREGEKLGEDEYRTKEGSFTTCEPLHPSWKFSATDLHVADELATGSNAVFYIEDVPVLYFPYIAFPAGRERQSGLLIPHFGRSTRKGLIFRQGYYLDIDPSHDATFTVEVQSKRGPGGSGEYRYLSSGGGEGKIRGFALYDDSRGAFRWELLGKSSAYLAKDLTFKADLNLVSDRAFYHDFGEESGEYNRKSVHSAVFLTKELNGFLVVPRAEHFYNIDRPNDTTLQTLPALSVSGFRRPLLHPLYYNLAAEATNFVREEGVSGERLQLRPEVSFYLHPLNGIDFTGGAAYRQRFYRSYNDGTTASAESGGPEWWLSLSSTIAGVHDVSFGGINRLRHVIVPEVRYVNQAQQDERNMPLFDFDDRPLRINRVEARVNGYFTAKSGSGETATYRDFASYGVSAGYNLSGGYRDLLLRYQSPEQLTDLKVDLEFRPVKELTLRNEVAVDPVRGTLSRVASTVGYELDKETFARFGYHYSRRSGRLDSFGEPAAASDDPAGFVNYLEGRFSLALVKPFVVNYTGRYSIDGGRFLESVYAVQYRHQCWSITLTYRDRRDEKEFLVNFALGGIGSVASIRAF